MYMTKIAHKRGAHANRKGKSGSLVFSCLVSGSGFSKPGGGGKTRRLDLALDLELNCAIEQLRSVVVEYHGARSFFFSSYF